MRLKSHFPLIAVLVMVFGWATPGMAQRHRATHLGNPQTRFAPSLTHPDQLRALFADPRLRADVESILRQASWDGDVEDLRRAAATARIEDIQLPPGTRMPFMSSRKQGHPVALIDVEWAGTRPVGAYAFNFESKGQRYRCITPKPCSNFYVVHLGPVPPPKLALTKVAPAEAVVCGPFPVSLEVRNVGEVPVTGVRVGDALPEGWQVMGGESVLDLDAGNLAPGAGMRFVFEVQAGTSGTWTNAARATSAEGAVAEAMAVTRVRAPMLTLECRTPGQVLLKRPIEFCLTVRNVGDAVEPRVTVTLPIPAGSAAVAATDGGQPGNGVVVWEWTDFEPGASRTVCVLLQSDGLGEVGLVATALGVCAGPVESVCITEVAGIPAILLEVVDLEDPVEVGETVTYDVRITNQGSAALTQVEFDAFLGEGQTFEGGTGPTPVRWEGDRVKVEPLPVLGPKAEVFWQVVVRAGSAADARFKVELISDQFVRPIDEYEATLQY